MGELKPIETCYDGYKFRSRLEARWAVFFHEAGIEYQYEPEGFSLPDGSWYLPDFYLPWFGMYIEIKPKDIDEKLIDKAERKISNLLNSYNPNTGRKCIVVGLFVGDPLDNDMRICFDYCDDEGGGTIWCNFGFYFGVCCERHFQDHKGHTYWKLQYNKDWVTIVFTSDPDVQSEYYDEMIINVHDTVGCHKSLDFAAVKARQARFEHGECG